MKILVLSHISEYAGGAEKSLIDLLDKWSANHDLQLEFVIKKPAGSLKKVLDDRDWKHHALEYTFWSESNPPKTNEEIFRHAVKNSRAITSIENIIKRLKPDIVMTNSVVCPWAAVAASYQNVPHAWFVREYGDLDHGRVFELGRIKTFQDVDSLSNLVVANSKTLEKHLAKYIDKEKLTTLYTPFDIKKLQQQAGQPARSPFKYKNSLKLVITGSLTPSKGQLEAVEAIGRLNKAGYKAEICLVGGNGPKGYRQKIKRAMKKYKITDNVHLVGHQKNPLAFVNMADAGIMASRKEAFGRVTFEYLAIGKPVVGTNSGATPEMVTNGKNGYLFEPKNIGQLTDCLKNYAQNKSLLAEHGKASEKMAEKMMMSEYNAANLFKKVKLAAESGEISDCMKPLNISHRWLEYIQTADNYIEETGKTSVKLLAKKRARARAGSSYHLARRTAKRIIRRG
jgi:glycosyltransferase involved in cell wall biosynthesis